MKQKIKSQGLCLKISSSGEKPKAVGIIFKDENGLTHRATLSKGPESEIIISSGAIGSPQLVLLSGIGPKKELKKHNISVVLNNKFVGKNMANNPLNTVFVPTNSPIEQSLIQTVGITKMGVNIEASSGFGQSSDSIHWDHDTVSAEGSASWVVSLYVGGTIFDRYGRRHTAAELLASANPEKIDVSVHATVQKIEFDTTGEKPNAVGVIFKDENGLTHRATLSKGPESEIIIPSELEKHNISVVLNNKFVGKNMADNPLNTIFVPTNGPIKQSLIQAVGITKMGVYIEASSGFGQSSDSIHWDHSIVSAEIGQLSTIPPHKRTHEAIHQYRRSKQNLPHEAAEYERSGVYESLAQEHKRHQIVSSVVDTVITIWHYHGGCHVGKVVDSNYKVIGVKGVRVVL
ncbi:hypothetical protein CASFOL_038566 [Castilleja foliolosa]|uniref:Glucose-methanol-choline oxidoreductase N-terminal domain-containing protein n=1 Tax=Castilleja foliolosa TaxID=1961234 RepID=A0ABD3BLE1_9LAMI